MNWFKNLSIRFKLLSLSMTAAGIALCISCIGFMAADLHILYEAKKSQLTAQAEMLGFNAGLVLSMQDERAADQLLAPLKHQTSLSAAALYGENRELVSQYTAEGQDVLPKIAPEKVGFSESRQGAVEVLQRVTEGNQTVGWVLLRADMQDYWMRRSNFLMVAFTVLVVSMAFTGILSNWLQRPIARPILELVEASQQITEQADLSIRVNYESRDEIGRLFAAFNRMLDRVQETELILRKHQEQLESRVRERTAELEQEIAERERVQQNLVIACDAAESSNQAKSEFLANMSHEIRTPMTAILGFSELLMNEFTSTKSEEERTAIETIQRNGEHLLTIINDILDLSKIEAGKMQLERIVCSPHQVAGEVVSLMRVRAKAKGLDLSLQYDEAIPEFFTSDPVRLRQILINLIGNAIKFTEKGSVSMHIGCELKRENPRLYFEVIDTGIGISNQQLSKLFQPFIQGDSSMSRLYGGTGLGLAIGRRMASLLGGELEVVSEMGVGSKFRLCLPTGCLDNVRMLSHYSEAGSHKQTAKSEADSHKPTAKKDVKENRLEGLKILVAEDGRDNQALIEYMLKKLGTLPVMVENGKLAIDAAIEARSEGKPFDLILCDMQMPVIDGYQAVAQLRTLGFSCPIVAITAHAMSGDRNRCLEAGCDDYLSKPLDWNRLVAIIKAQVETSNVAISRFAPGIASAIIPGPVSVHV